MRRDCLLSRPSEAVAAIAGVSMASAVCGLRTSAGRVRAAFFAAGLRADAELATGRDGEFFEAVLRLLVLMVIAISWSIHRDLRCGEPVTLCSGSTSSH